MSENYCPGDWDYASAYILRMGNTTSDLETNEVYNVEILSKEDNSGWLFKITITEQYTKEEFKRMHDGKAVPRKREEVSRGFLGHKEGLNLKEEREEIYRTIRSIADVAVKHFGTIQK